MLGRNLYELRRRMGEALAREARVDADLVMPVPDTGSPAAAGFAEPCGLPYREGMVRNRYVGRTFIQPSQPSLRQRGVDMKLSPLREVVRGRRLVVVDDSLVRGTTTRQIVSLLRRAGAAEVHVRLRRRPSSTHASTASTPRSRPSSSRPPRRCRRSASSSAPIRSPTCRSAASSRHSTSRTSGSASPASTGTTRSRCRTTRRAASSSWRTNSPSRRCARVAPPTPGAA